MAYRRTFKYFGGVPGRWFIDNFKAGIDKPDCEESWLNTRIHEFAQHYGVTVLSARSGRVIDKGLVEALVGAVRLRTRPFSASSSGSRLFCTVTGRSLL